LQPDKDRAIKWSGAIHLEIEWMLVELHTGIMRNQRHEFHKEKKINNGAKGRNQENKDKWEDGYNKLETKISEVYSPGLLGVRRTNCVNLTPICVH
jgi:hypothetical protein